MATVERSYLSVAETAKLVRQALKESFPRVKFSVRSSSYSGGASITINWTDGPNQKQVESVAKEFQGAYFDGSTDYQGCNYHALDGKPVRFGADFIFAERKDSDAAIERALRTIRARWPSNFEALADRITVEAFRKGALWNVIFFTGGGHTRDSVQAVINRELAKQSDRLDVAKSATLDRVRFRGDDGYGQGAVGKVRPQLQVIAGGAR